MEDEECVFCFEDLNKYDIALLNCPHKYHLHCIQNWNKKSKKYNIVCPQCNIDGEIVNIKKGEEDAPLLLEDSPPPNYNQNQIVRFPGLSPNMQQYTYYPIPIFDNLNDSIHNRNQNIRYQVPNNLQQNQVIYQNEYFDENLNANVNPPQNANANRPQNAYRYEDESIEPFICCNIL
jgi:hypothetical protein